MDAKIKDSVALDRFRVPTEQLTCAPFELGFASTNELEPLEPHVFICQPRVESALAKGLKTPGHIFAVTDTINTALLANLGEKAEAFMSGRNITDLVSLHNFSNPQRLMFLELGKGQACPFAHSMEKLLEELKSGIPKLLDGDDIKSGRKRISEHSSNIQRQAIAKLASEMASKNVKTQSLGEVAFAFEFASNGINMFPIIKSERNRPMKHEELVNLTESEREEISKLQTEYFPGVSTLAEMLQKMQRDAQDEIIKMEESFVDNFFRGKSEPLVSQYGERASDFINGLRNYTVQHIDVFLGINHENSSKQNHRDYPRTFLDDPFIPFRVNVCVDNSKTEGVPVIDHRNVDYGRLFGEVNYTLAAGGVPVGSHMSVRTGLLAEANHGILVLSAEDVLFKGLWGKLKAVLETRRLDIGSELPSFLRGNVIPETLHIDVKLVLVGDQHIYRHIFLNGPLAKDFYEIFKTVAEFDREAVRSPQVIDQLARLLALFCKRENIPPVSADGVAEFLKYLSRERGDQNKFSLDMRSLKDLLQEASSLAKKESAEDEQASVVIHAKHVKQAIHDKVYRSSLIQEKIYKMIECGDLILALAGSEVGQINGLSVLDLGSISFGRPNRITCRTFTGQAGVISIDRETKMSGRIHDKGVFTLEGYLGGKYAQDKKLALNATLSFEQSHDYIEGDSASSTELYAILSSLSGVPLRQDIAVTGSVNQKGEIQPIGGVIQKIEGFFDVCSAQELSGTQGVMIPRQNIKNLVLRDDIIAAVREGKFHIYAIKTVDEGMEILTGKKMGEPIKRGENKGKYPKGTINYLVEKRLAELAQAAK